MIAAIFSLYNFRYPKVLAYMLQRSRYHSGRYLAWYWRTQSFAGVMEDDATLSNTVRRMAMALRFGMALQIAAGLLLIALWYWHHLVAGWQFGVALLISYPLVWAHLAAVLAFLGWLMRPKKLGRAIVCRVLERAVIRLRTQHDFTVIAVVGSVGKTSTKAAIAHTLSSAKRVRWQEGNYNDRVTVPLVFFDQPAPNIVNVLSWLHIFARIRRMITQPYPYDAVIVELGIDGPGQMQSFAYLQPDIVVVAAITPEHMKYFGSLDAVASEELTALDFAKRALINTDDVPARYLKSKDFEGYGLSKSATYAASKRKDNGVLGQSLTLTLGEKGPHFTTTISLPGKPGATIAMAAAAVAALLDISQKDIIAGLDDVMPFPGRMQILSGIKDSTLIDDTYNASPVAVTAALDVLYKTKTPQRIAILGSMNELGDYSETAHKEVGEYCDPKKLAYVVTVGRDAITWLAPAAEARGCNVETCLSPYQAAEFVSSRLVDKAVVLAKGSQNGVFAEEALKLLLADPDDAQKLLRQSPQWLRVKQKQFGVPKN